MSITWQSHGNAQALPATCEVCKQRQDSETFIEWALRRITELIASKRIEQHRLAALK